MASQTYIIWKVVIFTVLSRSSLVRSWTSVHPLSPRSAVVRLTQGTSRPTTTQLYNSWNKLAAEWASRNQDTDQSSPLVQAKDSRNGEVAASFTMDQLNEMETQLMGAGTANVKNDWSILSAEWASRNQDTDVPLSSNTNGVVAPVIHNQESYSASFTMTQLHEMETQIMDLLEMQQYQKQSIAQAKQQMTVEYDQYRRDAHSQISLAQQSKAAAQDQLQDEIEVLSRQLQESQMKLSQESEKATNMVQQKEEFEKLYKQIQSETVAKIGEIQRKYEGELTRRKQELEEAQKLFLSFQEQTEAEMQRMWSLPLDQRVEEHFRLEPSMSTDQKLQVLEEQNKFLLGMANEYQQIMDQLKDSVQITSTRLQPLQLGEQVIKTILELRQENANYKTELEKVKQEASSQQKQLESQIKQMNIQFEKFKEDVISGKRGPVEEARELMDAMTQRMNELGYYLDEQITLTKKETERANNLLKEKDSAVEALKKKDEALTKKIESMQKRLEDEIAGRISDRKLSEEYAKEVLKETKTMAKAGSPRRKSVDQLGSVIGSLTSDLASRERALLKLRNNLVVLGFAAIVGLILSLAAERDVYEPVPKAVKPASEPRPGLIWKYTQQGQKLNSPKKIAPSKSSALPEPKQPTVFEEFSAEPKEAKPVSVLSTEVPKLSQVSEETNPTSSLLTELPKQQVVEETYTVDVKEIQPASSPSTTVPVAVLTETMTETTEVSAAPSGRAQQTGESSSIDSSLKEKPLE